MALNKGEERKLREMLNAIDAWSILWNGSLEFLKAVAIWTMGGAAFITALKWLIVTLGAIK